MDEAAISRIDAEHVWHPYGAMPAADIDPAQPRPLVVRGAQGVRLELGD
ncbi:adenosylmethionine--8-amino-7-oxononanoate aminotransferase BioA, partial [Streptomyces sp. SID10244]|nr:adenosylmethionine--8-amino-7-oxononanoate aminotransferase BioA [Streptomyces sp. SID10244]